jgi:hypothetical protein
LVPKKFVPSQEFLDYHFKIKFQGWYPFGLAKTKLFSQSNPNFPS